MWSNKGQSLIELVVVVAVAVIVVSALTFAAIASLRNASFAKSQAQATKLAQEGLEKVRTLRNRDGPVDYIRADLTHTSKFSDLWSIIFTCPTNCYFFLNDAGVLMGGIATSFESIESNFKRLFQIEEDGFSSSRKKITVIVKWTDFSGEHESKLTTVLRKP